MPEFDGVLIMPSWLVKITLVEKPRSSCHVVYMCKIVTTGLNSVNFGDLSYHIYVPRVCLTYWLLIPRPVPRHLVRDLRLPHPLGTRQVYPCCLLSQGQRSHQRLQQRHPGRQGQLHHRRVLPSWRQWTGWVNMLRIGQLNTFISGNCQTGPNTAYRMTHVNNTLVR